MKVRSNRQAKIWKQHYGAVPVDADGRSYDVHHIDGNPDNNNIENLIALPIHEHYQVHIDQGEYGAAMMIARRMKVKPADISETARKQMQERVEQGIHNFQVKGFVNAKDSNGNVHRVKKDDPRIVSGELVGVNTGYIVAVNKDGCYVRVTKDDLRLVTKELVPSNTGRKQKVVHSNRSHNKGKSWTQQVKEIPNKKCKYCDFVGRGSHVSRYHNERCKHYNES